VSSVDVIIPTFNGREHLRACLNALRAQTFRDLSVIVVDDGSNDATDQMMVNEFPEFSCLRLPRNLGFAAACNAGIAAGNADYVALLNNDAIPEPEWVGQLIDAMGRYPEAGALASKILLADGSGRLHAAGDTFSWSGLPDSRGVWELDRGQFDIEEPVFSACAAAALYRRDALDDAKRLTGEVFDTDFFMYCEDVDLGWRLRLLGWNTVYIPRARVTHHLSATGGGPLASYYVARNTFGVLLKNLPSGLQRRIWPRFLTYHVRAFAQALVHIREPAARARLRGILAGPVFAIKQRQKRYLIQSAYCASDEKIERLFK
jgi:GT2 family glycosyltransferase